MLQLILYIKSNLKRAAKIFNIRVNNQRVFAKRIKRRHKTFWNSSDAETVRNISMSSSQPLTEWKDKKLWQRKLSNKYNAREFAKLHNCKVPDLIWKGRNVNSIYFEKLPEYYVIRPTIGHSCKHVFLMANGINLMDKQTCSAEDIKAVLSESADQNPALEFLIEEFVKTECGKYEIPVDYKFYMFNGEIARIAVINRLGPKEGSVSCYNRDWNMVQNINENKYAKAEYQQSPKCLTEMIEHARKLSKTYEIFVRIDFYATDRGAVFGEFTPTPGSAKYLTPLSDNLFIKYWDSYCKGKI